MVPTERQMPNLPTGTVTFLFTDIEGSTTLITQAAPADGFKGGG